MQASSNVNVGIKMGTQAVISDCNASLNATGIDANYGVVRDCIVSGNTGIGIDVVGHSVIEGNASRNNGGAGINITGNSNTIRSNDFMHNGFSSLPGGLDVDVMVGALDNVFEHDTWCVVRSTNASTQTSVNFQRTAAGC